MKKLFRTVLAVAVAAAAMTSCAKEMQENFTDDAQYINVNFVSQDADTKTEFGTPEAGKIPVIWKEGDKVGLNVNLNGDMKVIAVDAVPTDGGKKAQFKYEGEISGITAPFTFYVISPNTGYVSSSTKNGYLQFLVPSKQSPTETSVDPAAQILFAISNTYESIPTDEVNLQFEHLVAYANISVKNLDTKGKKVSGIDLIFDANVIGRYYIYPAKTGDERVVESAGDKTVSLVTSRLENNIFSVMPVDVSGKTLTVIVKVDGGSYKKQINIPSDKAFKAGVISKFSVDMTGATYEEEKIYSLVTDVSTLKAGDQVIIGTSASLDTYGFAAMSTTQQQYNVAAVLVDDILKEKKLIAPGANIDVFTLEEGSTAGHFYLKSSNGKYLLRNPDSARAGNKNDLIARLKTDADYDDGCANWQFTLVNAETGELTIIANTTISSRKYIKANPNSGTMIFSCYSKGSSMVAPCLYKLDVSIPKVVDIWVNDETGNTPVDGGAEAKSDDWLSYAGGVASWTANTTNAPRTKTLELADGAKITVTQLEAKDFKGTYDFTTKAFCTDGFITAGNKQTISNITFGEPLLGETLKDSNNVEHTNTIGINGLYHAGIIADAAVDIDYKEKSVKLGVFLDGRKAQKDNSLTGEYQYVAFLPGLCAVSAAGSFAKPWTFCNPDLGEPDYEWLWFDTTDLTTFTYSCAKVAQKLSTGGYSATPYILGICINVFKAEEATTTNAKGNYNVVYQFNIDAGNVGLQFKRKTEN